MNPCIEMANALCVHAAKTAEDLDTMHGDPSKIGNWIRERKLAREVVACVPALLEEVGSLHQAIDMATGPHCSSCGNPVDPDTCHCGDYAKGHGGYDSHPFTPMGCICGYAEPDWKTLAISRGEYMHALRVENAKLMATSGPTVNDLTSEIERLRAEVECMRPVFVAAVAWRDGGCSDSHTTPLIHAVDATTEAA